MINHDAESVMCLVRLNIALGHFKVSPFTNDCVHWDCDFPEAVDGHSSKARSQDEAQVSRLHEIMPATGVYSATTLTRPRCGTQTREPHLRLSRPEPARGQH